MDDKKEDYPDPERTPQKNCPKQQQNHNVPTDDMENTNSENRGRCLPLTDKLWTLPR